MMVLRAEKPKRPQFVDINDMMVEGLDIEKSHRYLGRQLSLDKVSRTKSEIDSRIQLAWGKFHAQRR